MSHFTAAVHDLAPVLITGIAIGLGGYVATYLWEERDYKRRAREHAAAQERAERQERVNKFAADTRAAFEAQMPDRAAQVERIRAQIAENETRRFIEAWDRGEVQP